MAQQVSVDPAARADDPDRNEPARQVAPDLAYLRVAIVNVVLFGPRGAGDRGWVLVDAGLPGTSGRIMSAAAERFAADARPAAIILTHAHFDHVGALLQLAGRWDAPVYAHELERPYLDGHAAYPPPDPGVGGGLMATLSSLFPREPLDLLHHLHPLPTDGSVPEMPGWRWLHTPGHTPGHISLWRENDRSIIAGDAFITTRQESAYAALTQAPELHGPPMYFTQNWEQARQSVVDLAALAPELAVTGHGPALRGPELRASLDTLAREFDRVAVPPGGRYVEAPARAEDGTAYDAR